MKLSQGFLLGVLVVLAPLAGRGGIPESEYRDRRAKLIGEIDSTTACVFRAADARMRSNDVEYRYRQESNILYLTGISEPGFVLLISPRGIQVDGGSCPIVLFCKKGPMAKLRAAGSFPDGLLVDEERFDEIFEATITPLRVLYVSAPDIHFVNDWLNNKPMFLDAAVREGLHKRHGALKIKNAALLLSPLREIKSPAELELIRKAIQLTGDGLRSAMNLCRPGAMEYELQAALEYEMIRQGADYESFPSIIGSGPNSVILHYSDNRRQIGEHDVVVMDVGAEYDGYAADITRTIPASGRFTPQQRRIYLAVLKAQREVISIIAPGLPWSALQAKALAVIASEGFGNHMDHGVSHHVGLDVHDAGEMDTLRAGMVITVEPGIYIPEGDTAFAAGYRGNGVRLEDDVLVGEKGPVVLSDGIPKEIDAIEKLVGASKRSE